MRVDFDVAMEVAAHEALVRQAYKDSAGVLTWCVGMTNATGHKVERYIGKPARLSHCMALYAWALDRYAAGVLEAFAGRELTKAQFAAALSFQWNTGAIKRASWVKSWLAGDVAKARQEFMNWVTPKEITARRQKERDLFFDGKWSNNGTMTEYTRVRANMAPDWSSARRINVEAELRAAFATPIVPTLDQQPQPDLLPPAPTLSPADVEIIPADPIILPETAPVPTQAPSKPLTPIEQMNKPIQGAKTGAASAGIGGAILVLWSTSGYMPEAWQTPGAMAALGMLFAAVPGLVGSFIAAYRARDLRFMPKNAGLPT